MKVLIVGGGGREHALAWKAAQSPHAERVFVAPGNAGTAAEVNVENIDIGAEDRDALLDFALREPIGLTIIGPEAPLVAGIVDEFEAQNLRCLGPSRGAAQLEGSKAFAKDFLARHNIPTAGYEVFKDSTAAIAHIDKRGTPVVIKADGLAAGKGVVIAHTKAQAAAAIRDMMDNAVFGAAGNHVVVEDFLSGEEASFIVVCDGEHCVPLASSQDHKARDDGDTGPNTGGMGAYSPAPVVTPDVHQRIMDTVIYPSVNGMAADGWPYRGFLYAGVMIAPDGTPQVLEFNCRFGDPETQPILLRLRSDLVELCLSALDSRLDQSTLQWDERAAVGVVLAAGGYPGSYEKGKPITGLEHAAAGGAKVFHAGTAEHQGAIVTAGGRVLCVCALGNSVGEAQQQAYAGVAAIDWEAKYYRRDIGYRALARERSE